MMSEKLSEHVLAKQQVTERTHAETEEHKSNETESSVSQANSPPNVAMKRATEFDFVKSLEFLSDPARALSRSGPIQYRNLFPDFPHLERPRAPAPTLSTVPPTLPKVIPADQTSSLIARPGAAMPSMSGNAASARLATGKPPIEPKLENIVSTLDLGCKLDLRKIALQAKNSEYNPKRFAAVIMRIQSPKTTALIFSSGKMVCTGAKTETDSRTAAMKYAKTIKKIGFDVRFKNFTIQNIVGSCAVEFRISLEHLKVKYEKFCTYDPEIFPGLIFRMENPKIVLLIFCSGKVVLTGAKLKEDLFKAFGKIFPVLKGCRVEGPVPEK